MASPSMSTESARSAVEPASSPALNSVRNMTALMHNTTSRIRRWSRGTSATSQQSFISPRCAAASIGLDRQAGILRPFEQGAVIEREVLEAQLVQHEEVEGSGDRRATVGDDT